MICRCKLILPIKPLRKGRHNVGKQRDVRVGAGADVHRRPGHVPRAGRRRRSRVGLRGASALEALPHAERQRNRGDEGGSGNGDLQGQGGRQDRGRRQDLRPGRHQVTTNIELSNLGITRITPDSFLLDLKHPL